jgi:hypothetical protein
LVSLSSCPDCPLAPVVIQWLHSQEIEDRIEEKTKNSKSKQQDTKYYQE